MNHLSDAVGRQAVVRQITWLHAVHVLRFRDAKFSIDLFTWRQVALHGGCATSSRTGTFRARFVESSR